jgi:3-hydroxyisobutyrate dehydrogenase-like beta-hydroxyacid dehydrogenase
MLADVIAAAAELQVAGEAMDLDPEHVFWVLTRVAPTLEPRRVGFVEDRHTPAMFALRDLRKDLHLALELIATSPARTPLTVRASDQIDAVAAETPDLDISAVVRPYRDALSRRPVLGSVGRSGRFV